MQILFILLPKSKKTRLLSIEVTENMRRGSSYSILFSWFNQRWVTRGKKKKSLLAKQNKLQKRKTEQAEIWHFLVTPAS